MYPVLGCFPPVYNKILLELSVLPSPYFKSPDSFCTPTCFTTANFEKTLHDITKVTFKNLSDEEIWHYINTSKPVDKAGAYGIQEWIGQIGVTKLEGSYFNVMGLPTHLVYKTLNDLADW